MHALSQPQIAPGETHAARPGEAQSAPISQALTLILDAITSDDYLQWVRDPDPPTHGDLKLVSVRSAPLSNRIQLELISGSGLPAPRLAAQAVGFPITADVVSVRSNLRTTPQIGAGCAQPDRRSSGQDNPQRRGRQWGQRRTPPRLSSDPSGSSATA